MSALPDLKFTVNATNSCNWRCCARCTQMSEDDPVYLTDKYAVKRLNPGSPKAKELMNQTHQRIDQYISEKLRASPEIPPESVPEMVQSFRKDVLDKTDKITVSDLKRIEFILSKMKKDFNKKIQNPIFEDHFRPTLPILLELSDSKVKEDK